IGEACARPDQARLDGVGSRIEDSRGILVVEALAIDEEQRASLLRRQLSEKRRGESIEIGAAIRGKEPVEVLFARFRLAQRVGVIAQLGEQQPIDLGEGPAIERGAALIAVMIGKHAQKRAAKEGLALPLLADQHVGKTLEPWQHGDELMPQGWAMGACLHAWFPPPLG